MPSRTRASNTIAIVSVNDAFVMNAWKRDTDQRDEAIFLADGNAEFTKAIGMELDASGNGLGIRSKRYSMLVDDGVVKKLNLEPAPGKVEVSGGDTLLGQLCKLHRSTSAAPMRNVVAPEGLIRVDPTCIGLSRSPERSDCAAIAGNDKARRHSLVSLTPSTAPSRRRRAPVDRRARSRRGRRGP